MMIRLAKPTISENAIQTVGDILRSGNLVQGEYVRRLEKDLAAYLNVEHAVLVSSGTAALHLALVALGIGSGDEVIVPGFTFPATANVVELVGASPVLVDITTDDFCIDIAQIASAITERTRVVLPVHEFGQSADMKPILDLAQSHGLYLVEDAACALGTEYNQTRVGAFGQVGCFSLHPRKAITSGEGGVLTTNDDGLADTFCTLRNHGIKYTPSGLDFVAAGFNYRMTDFQAAMCIDQLETLEAKIGRRISQADLYDQGFAGQPGIITPKRFSNRRMVYQTYHLLLDASLDRNMIIARLRERGVETNYGAQALHMMQFFRQSYGYTPDDFPQALRAYQSGLALPIGAHLSFEDVENVITIVIECVSSA